MNHGVRRGTEQGLDQSAEEGHLTSTDRGIAKPVAENVICSCETFPAAPTDPRRLTRP